MTRKTLYRNVLRLTRLSPADLIRQYYLHKAASLLQEGYTVAEAAYRVGFTTPSHFAMVFKQYYGQTPRQFGSATQQQPQMPPI
jgi:AraC-like DNA-binding protein